VMQKMGPANMDVDALLPAGCEVAIQEADKLQKANVKLG
jgi:type VI secretion system secreted protein VgrG